MLSFPIWSPKSCFYTIWRNLKKKLENVTQFSGSCLKIHFSIRRYFNAFDPRFIISIIISGYCSRITTIRSSIRRVLQVHSFAVDQILALTALFKMSKMVVHHTVLHGSRREGLLPRYPAPKADVFCRRLSCVKCSYYTDPPRHRSAAATCKISDFITAPDLWPSNSPDLDPVNYKIWSIRQLRM